MSQDSTDIDSNWALVIDDKAMLLPEPTEEERRKYDAIIDDALASIDFDNL